VCGKQALQQTTGSARFPHDKPHACAARHPLVLHRAQVCSRVRQTPEYSKVLYCASGTPGYSRVLRCTPGALVEYDEKEVKARHDRRRHRDVCAQRLRPVVPAGVETRSRHPCNITMCSMQHCSVQHRNTQRATRNVELCSVQAHMLRGEPWSQRRCGTAPTHRPSIGFAAARIDVRALSVACIPACMVVLLRTCACLFVPGCVRAQKEGLGPRGRR
jgi:hypothetical protein